MKNELVLWAKPSALNEVMRSCKDFVSKIPTLTTI